MLTTFNSTWWNIKWRTIGCWIVEHFTLKNSSLPTTQRDIMAYPGPKFCLNDKTVRNYVFRSTCFGNPGLQSDPGERHRERERERERDRDRDRRRDEIRQLFFKHFNLSTLLTDALALACQLGNPHFIQAHISTWKQETWSIHVFLPSEA